LAFFIRSTWNQPDSSMASMVLDERFGMLPYPEGVANAPQQER